MQKKNQENKMRKKGKLGLVGLALNTILAIGCTRLETGEATYFTLDAPFTIKNYKIHGDYHGDVIRRYESVRIPTPIATWIKIKKYEKQKDGKEKRVATYHIKINHIKQVQESRGLSSDKVTTKIYKDGKLEKEIKGIPSDIDAEFLDLKGSQSRTEDRER